MTLLRNQARTVICVNPTQVGFVKLHTSTALKSSCLYNGINISHTVLVHLPLIGFIITRQNKIKILYKGKRELRIIPIIV